MFPYHHLNLLAALGRTVSSYLEIGVQEGRSLSAVISARTIERLALCDTWGNVEGGTNRGNHQHIVDLLHAHAYDGDVKFLDGPSTDLLPLLDADDVYDLVLVDADHTEQACYMDMALAWSHCGRIMVVHDFNHPPIQQAVLRVLSERASDVCSVVTFKEENGTAVIYKAQE